MRVGRMQYSVKFPGYNNDEEFQSALKVMLRKGAFATDLLITLDRRQNFVYDEKFVQSINEHPEGDVSHLMWRLHTACWAAHTCLGLEGAFVECGVQDGVFATMIIEYLSLKNSKEFYLYDSFDGFPEHYLEQGNNREINSKINYEKYLDHGQYEKLLKRFSSYENVHVLRGPLPENLEDNCPEKISFVHMDLTNYESERDVLAILIDKIVPGGMVLFQGYEIDRYELWQMSEADFIKDNNIRILSLPTGQGLFVKT